jgi:hypothetical protein
MLRFRYYVTRINQRSADNRDSTDQTKDACHRYSPIRLEEKLEGTMQSYDRPRRSCKLASPPNPIIDALFGDTCLSTQAAS